MELLKEFMEVRGDIYSILSVPFYKELTAEYIDVLKKYLPVIKKLSLESGNSRFTDAVNRFEPILDAEFDKNLYDGEFSKLFLGVNKASHTGHTVTPHESVFLSPSHLVMQEPWEDVVEIFFNNGLGKDKTFKEPEDHITAEMSFMAFMSKKAAEHIAYGSAPEVIRCMEVQEMFLKRHLCSWVHLLADDVLRSSDLDFYKHFPKMVECFMEADIATMEQLKEELTTVS
ncbi:TorD/DmsD family molecular chaperone [Seleniivibrio woodruffii]|uniref:TorD/DmsD family molecular chaperone n=1 Tax=Seleniivibrio woodruffii TaxID=1078050 RepID=UPI002409F815|nr:molecular chaperone TorD family protein [Seleniivibrio woodruffii]